MLLTFLIANELELNSVPVFNLAAAVNCIHILELPNESEGCVQEIYYYIRYDLKEIAFPSSFPDPPHIKKRGKLTWEERIRVLKRAAKLYAASWVRDIGPNLRPNDYKKDDMADETNGEKKTTKGKEPSTLEDLGTIFFSCLISLCFLELMVIGLSKLRLYDQSSMVLVTVNYRRVVKNAYTPWSVAARGGMETLRPALQRVYMTRASACRDALRSFIEGYQEGVQQVMEKKEDSKTQEDADRMLVMLKLFAIRIFLREASCGNKLKERVSPNWQQLPPSSARFIRRRKSLFRGLQSEEREGKIRSILKHGDDNTRLAGLAFMFSASILLQILACAIYNNWWPMLSALMYVLVPMPCLFFGGGSTQFLMSRDGGGWIDAAKFLTGASAIGSIAIPIILKHAHMIETGAMLIELVSFFIFICTVMCFHQANLDDDW
ncbi:hypothetical protein VNO77_17830 [Canavalia gladiata]|uniref:Uncharacterized protein n=1 Tax=Canavalia gladiata TaxID=3824 RepID=A0AAN9QH11_CANGL